MKKIMIPLLLLSSFLTISAQVIFEEDFESYPDFTITNFGDWTMYDLDATPTWGTAESSYPNQGYIGSAIILNVNEIQDGQIPFDPTVGNYSIRDTGEKYASFWCAQEVTNNNYLISPIIDLDNTTLPKVSFWSKSLASAVSGFDPEEFEVLISTTGTNVADFTINLGTTNVISTCCNWIKYEYDLSNYIGSQVYIAIHHISTQNSYALHIDDFKVEHDATASINDINNIDFTYYPNPVKNTLTINSNKTIIDLTITNTLGQIVQVQKGNDIETIVDTSKLENGVYYTTISTNKTKVAFSFIKY